MNWNERYPKDKQPTLSEMEHFIDSPLWGRLCTAVEQTYGVKPVTEHSRCSGAPGWNIKYKKGGRSLCTLYPSSGYFTCLLAIGGEAAVDADLAIGAFCEYTRTLYLNAMPLNGYRWMMIEVRDESIMNETLALIAIRATHRTQGKSNAAKAESV